MLPAMISRRLAIASVATVAIAAGGAGAIAATVKDDRKEAETAILSDAAKRLDVSPSELRDALGKAQDAQLDRAVKDGRLTQAQADAMKERRAESGLVLGGPHGGPRGHHGPGLGMRGGAGMVAAAAKALGLSQAELFEQLRDGKTLAAIAKAQDKDLDDVKSATKAALTRTLDAAVKDDKITDAQRDRVLERFDEHFDRFASGEGRMGRRFGGRGHGGPGMDGGPGMHGRGMGGGAGYGPGTPG